MSSSSPPSESPPPPPAPAPAPPPSSLPAAEGGESRSPPVPATPPSAPGAEGEEGEVTSTPTSTDSTTVPETTTTPVPAPAPQEGTSSSSTPTPAEEEQSKEKKEEAADPTPTPAPASVVEETPTETPAETEATELESENAPPPEAESFSPEARPPTSPKAADKATASSPSPPPPTESSPVEMVASAQELASPGGDTPKEKEGEEEKEQDEGLNESAQNSGGPEKELAASESPADPVTPPQDGASPTPSKPREDPPSKDPPEAEEAMDTEDSASPGATGVLPREPSSGEPPQELGETGAPEKGSDLTPEGEPMEDSAAEPTDKGTEAAAASEPMEDSAADPTEKEPEGAPASEPMEDPAAETPPLKNTEKETTEKLDGDTSKETAEKLDGDAAQETPDPDLTGHSEDAEKREKGPADPKADEGTEGLEKEDVADKPDAEKGRAAKEVEKDHTPPSEKESEKEGKAETGDDPKSVEKVAEEKVTPDDAVDQPKESSSKEASPFDTLIDSPTLSKTTTTTTSTGTGDDDASGDKDPAAMDTSETPTSKEGTPDDTGGGGLSIAAVSSLQSTDNDAIVVLDEDQPTSADSDKDPSSKKPTLKLASFADLGSNGITDDTPVTAAAAEGPKCSQCHKGNNANFASLVWETMQFCNQKCLGEYQTKFSNCATCKKLAPTSSLGKYCVCFGADIKQFCSIGCLEEHKKNLKVCCYCQKDLNKVSDSIVAPVGEKQLQKDFCDNLCLEKYKILYCGQEKEKETANCDVCGQLKTVEVELIEKEKSKKFCCAQCFGAYKFTNTLDTLSCAQCKTDFDLKVSNHVIYYDGLAPRFCTLACRNVYVKQNRKTGPCSWCKVRKYNFDMIEHWTSATSKLTYCSINCLGKASQGNGNWNGGGNQQQSGGMPVIHSVSSLATATAPVRPPPPAPVRVQVQTKTIREVIKDVMIHQPEPVKMVNKAVLTKPFMQTKGVSCRPHPCHKQTQTDGPNQPSIVPLAVPMFMPMPMQMYNAPYPVPIPVPIPVPVPVFIPTTRNSMRGIMKQIKKIQAKLPADPFEAELLAMAGALTEKKDDVIDSDDSLDDDNGYKSPMHDDNMDRHHAPRNTMTPAMDFENDIQGGRIVPKPLPMPTPDPAVSPGPNQRAAALLGRTPQQQQGYQQQRSGQKRRYSEEENVDDPQNWQQGGNQWQRRSSGSNRSRQRNNRPKQARTDGVAANAATPAVPQQPKERPDAKHHLKFTYGVNAWKHWVVQKNAELEKARAQGKYMKTFETDILKLRADELNYTLCMFVKEVKKPNGDCYAPDSILYLTLGIQEYLFENGRIDNIFTDQYYEPFTSALHDVVKDFKLPVNELGYFVTRIEEEHLWESKQLGAHSPQVLLNTLIYFNTKYFMLKNQDNHRKLSFTSIMKHWKKSQTPVKPGATEKKTILLRYYPQQVKNKGRADERKCYEQVENTDNLHRCPIHLYTFYLSKCPETSKTRSDMFYLQPERNCVGDSPVWYSNGALNNHQMDKMLQRLLMVREIQEHMLADAS